MPKILRLYRNNNLKSSFDEAKDALLSLENLRADGEEIICRYMDDDGKIKAAMAVYSRGQSGSGVTIFKCSDEIAKDINRVMDELDATQKGAGLNDDGTYTPPTNDDILEDAVSLFDADQKLADAIRKEIQDRIDAINALDYEDTEIEGQVVVSVSEQDGIVSNQKKKIKDIVLTDYQGQGEEGSLNISTETIGDAFGSIEKYIKNLDVAPISAEGYAIVKVSEENGRISAETGTINAETVNIKDFNDIIDADNVEDALQEMKKQIDQVKLTSDDASITITKPNDHKQPTDIGVNIKTGERIIRKDGNSGIYTSITLEKLTSGLAANIREQYQVKDSYGIIIGEPINIYKDSALLSVALLHSTNNYKPTYNKNNGSWSDIANPDETNLSLCFAYEDVNGDVQIIAIPVGSFLRESEFKDGLVVNVNGEVLVLVDPSSGKVVTKDGQVDVLTVSPAGVKVSNIQEAIDWLNENLTKALNDESNRAQAAENALRSALDQEIQDRKDGDKNLDDALKAEIQRAKDAERDLDTALSNEITRATNRENDIERSLNAEIQRAQNAESDLNTALSNEITRATNRENDIEKSLNDEIKRAQDAEKVITDNLTSEINRAKEAEEKLKDDLSDEIARAKKREDEIEASLNTEIERAKKAENDTLTSAKSYTDQKFTEEKNRAELAEQDLRNAIKDEQSRAERIEDSLRHDIENEKSRAELAELGLSKDIEKEEQRAVAEEKRLEDLIKAEQTRAEKAESDLDKKISDETDRAKGEEKRIEDLIKAEQSRAEKAESDLSTAIEKEKERAMQAEKDTLTSANNYTDKETDRAKGEEARIEGLIKDERDRAMGVERDLSTSVENERNRATQRENEIEGKINQEIADRQSGDNYLEGLIAQEINNTWQKIVDLSITAQGWDDTIFKALVEQLNQEITNRTTEDGNIRNDLSAEQTARSNEDSRLAGLISSLETTSNSADTALQINIDAVNTRIDNLNATVGPETGKFVTKVVQTKGLISGELGDVSAEYVKTNDGSNVQIEINNIKSRLTTTEGKADAAVTSVKAGTGGVSVSKSANDYTVSVGYDISGNGSVVSDAYTDSNGKLVLKKGTLSYGSLSGTPTEWSFSTNFGYNDNAVGSVNIDTYSKTVTFNGTRITGSGSGVDYEPEAPIYINGNEIGLRVNGGSDNIIKVVNGELKATVDSLEVTAKDVKVSPTIIEGKDDVHATLEELWELIKGGLGPNPEPITYSAGKGIDITSKKVSVDLEDSSLNLLKFSGSSDNAKLTAVITVSQPLTFNYNSGALSLDYGDNLYVDYYGRLCATNTNTDTTYSNGDGLNLSGTRFSVKPDPSSNNILTVSSSGVMVDKTEIQKLIPINPNPNPGGETTVYTPYYPLEFVENDNGSGKTAIKLKLSADSGNALKVSVNDSGLYCPSSGTNPNPNPDGTTYTAGDGIKIEQDVIAIDIFSKLGQPLIFETSQSGKKQLSFATPVYPLYIQNDGRMAIDFDKLISTKEDNILGYDPDGGTGVGKHGGLYVKGVGGSPSSELSFTSPLKKSGTIVSLDVAPYDPEGGQLLKIHNDKLSMVATCGPGILFTSNADRTSCSIEVQIAEEEGNCLKVIPGGLYVAGGGDGGPVDMPTEVDCGTFSV